MNEQNRQKFEKWAKDEGWPDWKLSRSHSGKQYMADGVNDFYRGWIAASRFFETKTEDLCDVASKLPHASDCRLNIGDSEFCDCHVSA
jgi:hypothetical protein